MIYRNNQLARAVGTHCLRCRHGREHQHACVRAGGAGSCTRRQRSALSSSRVPHSATQPDQHQPSYLGRQRGLKLEGVTRVEDLVNNLPQAVADFGGNISNGATGAADGEPSRPGLATHPGAGEQPSPDAGRSDTERRFLAGPQPDSPVRWSNVLKFSPAAPRQCMARTHCGRRGQLHHE